jgi:phenylpyruvate tautomerase PptA (4-oxalocrotonate tautomerase family)
VGSAAGEGEGPSRRAKVLADQLRAAAAGLIAVIERIEPERWDRVRKPGEWSPGKDAEHAADAAAMHLWHVYLSLGMHEPDPPVIERARLTAVRSQAEVVTALRSTAEHGARLIEGLTDVQLELAAKPTRRPSRAVADIVARPLIRHLGTHREEIEMKLRARAT